MVLRVPQSDKNVDFTRGSTKRVPWNFDLLDASFLEVILVKVWKQLECSRHVIFV